MIIYVKLDVKFRAFFIDFAKFSKEYTEPLTVLPNSLPYKKFIDLNYRGVKLTAEIKNAV